MDKEVLANNIKSALIRRRCENTELGVPDRDNRFDSKLFALYGELLAEIKTKGKREGQVNHQSHDIISKLGKKIQAKARAIYSSNNDAIHIDFSDLDFDYLFLLVVDDHMDHKAEIFLSKSDLEKLCYLEKSGKYRLRNVRTRYKEYEAHGHQ